MSLMLAYCIVYLGDRGLEGVHRVPEARRWYREVGAGVGACPASAPELIPSVRCFLDILESDSYPWI